MADIKTHLRELSVATTIGLLKNGIPFTLVDFYNPPVFYSKAQQVISTDISNASNLCDMHSFTPELKLIIRNGFNLGSAIFKHSEFSNINKNSIIEWQGFDTAKDDPIDITVGPYGFSLKENSDILGNIGLYKLLNAFTGSNYTTRHIFKDYAPHEYNAWFEGTWNQSIKQLKNNRGIWKYENPSKHENAIIKLFSNTVKLEYHKNGIIKKAILPLTCSLSLYEQKTTSKIREKVFSRFINTELSDNPTYRMLKRKCAIASATALAKELKDNLNYNTTLPIVLRIHDIEYYYAKTTAAGIEIFKVPPISNFRDDIVIESIQGSVPKDQVNILTTIKNRKTGKSLVLRNECRFSHGQFNGTPESKMYYEHGGSLEIIYEKI